MAGVIEKGSELHKLHLEQLEVEAPVEKPVEEIKIPKRSKTENKETE